MRINGLALQSIVGVVGQSEEEAGLLVGDAMGSFVLFIILFTCVTSNSRFVALPFALKQHWYKKQGFYFFIFLDANFRK